jgi:hypothetical protein
MLFEGDRLARVVTISPRATVYKVHRSGAQVIDEPLEAELLRKTP